MVQVYAYQNSLKLEEGKDKYCFRSVVDQTVDSEQLVKEIVGYNSTLTDADVRAVMSVLDNRVKHFVNRGYRVELPFGYLFNRANGTVRRLTDGFAPGSLNHRISPAFKFKEDSMAEMAKDAAYRMAGNGFVMQPSIAQLCSKTADGRESESLAFARGDMLCVKGKRLSFDPGDRAQGLFLVGEDKNEVRLSSYNRIGTNVVEAYIPAGIRAGKHELKLVSKPGTERYAACIAPAPISVSGEGSLD